MALLLSVLRSSAPFQTQESLNILSEQNMLHVEENWVCFYFAFLTITTVVVVRLGTYP